MPNTSVAPTPDTALKDAKVLRLLLATLPRQIGETLAQTASLQVLVCPIAIPSFTVNQHWHTRYHDDGANQWLLRLVAELFLRKD
jgi:hypothetical protein